ncbi:glycosyltransferase family 39 protein [bacterium]|nr:glycosyltransferase family 39 protein [bacterium]
MLLVSTTGRARATRRAALVVVAAAAFVFLLRPAVRSYNNRDVSRYAQMAFEMRHDETLVPTLWRRPYHEAMPLAAWAPLAVARLEGEVTPLSGRLLPALSALGMVAVTLVLAWRHGSARLGLLAGAIVVLNYLVGKYGRESRIDPLLGFAVTAAVGAFFHASERDDRKWYLVSGVALALGIAAKGPLSGIVLPAAAVVPYLAVARKGRALVLGGSLALAVAGALTAAWFLPYRAYLGPLEFQAFVDQFLRNENLAKLTEGYGKEAPPWMYLECAPHFAPWIVASVFAFVRILRAPRGATPLELLAASWTLVPLLALSVASGKHPRYLVPLVAGLAILAASQLEVWLETASRKAPEALARGLSAFALVALLAGIAAPVVLTVREGASPYALGTGLATVLGGALALSCARRREVGSALLGLYVASAAAVAFYNAEVLSLPEVQRRNPYFRLAEDLSPRVSADAPLAVLEERDPAEHDAIDHAQLGLHLSRWAERLPRGTPPASGFVLSRELLPGWRLVSEHAWRPPNSERKESERWLLLLREEKKQE